MRSNPFSRGLVRTGRINLDHVQWVSDSRRICFRVNNNGFLARIAVGVVKIDHRVVESWSRLMGVVGYRGPVVCEIERVKDMWERHFDFEDKFDGNQKLIEVD